MRASPPCSTSVSYTHLDVYKRQLKELSDRGHSITAIARHPERIASLPGVNAVQGDVYDQQQLTALLEGHDTVISAVHFSASDARILLDAVKAAGTSRYLVVGGAGSLEVAPGVSLISTCLLYTSRCV